MHISIMMMSKELYRLQINIIKIIKTQKNSKSNSYFDFQWDELEENLIVSKMKINYVIKSKRKNFQ